MSTMKVRIDYIPQGHRNRPGTKANMQWITIHNTANPTSTAANERNWVLNRIDKASFHYAVDDREAVAIIPEDEIAWHTGTSLGNQTSIGIEVCESGNQEITWNNAVSLTAQLLYKRQWTTTQVRTHKSWSGKNCPNKLLPRWQEFLNAVELELKQIKAANDGSWKYDGLNYLHEIGILNDLDLWKEKIDEPMPVWAVTLLMKRICEKTI